MLGYFYEDFMGLEGASGQRSDLSGKRRISRGAAFTKATPTGEPPPEEQAEADEASGGNGADAEPAEARLPRLRRRKSRLARPRAQRSARRLEPQTADEK